MLKIQVQQNTQKEYLKDQQSTLSGEAKGNNMLKMILLKLQALDTIISIM